MTGIRALPGPGGGSVSGARGGARPAAGVRAGARTLGAVVAVGVLTWGVAAAVRLPGGSPWSVRYGELGFFSGLFALFLIGAWLVAGLAARRAALLTVLGAAALQIAAFTTGPRYSDDLYRYVWDGRVQAHGIDPYRYVPVATRLTGLRDSVLFPAAPVSGTHCVAAAPGIAPGCTLLNRPLVHTVYPPVAQAYFVLVHWWGPRGVQIAAGGLALAVTLFLIWALPAVGKDPRLAVLWGWCPAVAVEAGNNGHVDVLGVLLTAFALVLLARNRVAAGGAVLGLAVAAKVTPILALPGSMRRRPADLARLLVSLAGVIVLVYVPHLLAVGGAAGGFFGGYLKEEGYDSGQRFALLAKVLPGSWAQTAAVVILGLTALAVWRRSDPARPWRGALTMAGMALLVAEPTYPWYAMLLVLFVAVEGWRGTPWLALALAAYPVQSGVSPAVTYGVGGAVVAAGLGGVRLADRLRLRRTAPGAGAGPAVAAEPPIALPGPASRVPLAVPAADRRVDVILPCLNEAAALPYVLGRMPAGYRAIVVDNGSTDGSGDVAAALGAAVVYEGRPGFGAACHAGLEAASAEVVCFLDCDGSFDPMDLPKVAAAVLDGEADLFLGQRNPVARDAWPPHARLANRVLARRIRRATGVRIKDLGPMRAARRDALLELGIVDRRFGYPLEMVLKAARAGWTIAEVDVPYAPRTGKSKVTGTVAGTVRAVRDMRKVWKAATQ